MCSILSEHSLSTDRGSALDMKETAVEKTGPNSLPSSSPSTRKADRIDVNLSSG